MASLLSCKEKSSLRRIAHLPPIPYIPACIKSKASVSVSVLVCFADLPGVTGTPCFHQDTVTIVFVTICVAMSLDQVFPFQKLDHSKYLSYPDKLSPSACPFPSTTSVRCKTGSLEIHLGKPHVFTPLSLWSSTNVHLHVLVFHALPWLCGLPQRPGTLLLGFLFLDMTVLSP